MPPQDVSPQDHWQAEYEFYRKIITDEVERLRFNDGLEPVEVDLYPTRKTRKGVPGPDFLGVTTIGHQKFQAIGKFVFTPSGKALRVTILAQPGK